MYLVALAHAHGVGCLYIEVGDSEAQGSSHAHRASTVGEGYASVEAALLDVGEGLELDGVAYLAVARNVVGAGDGAVALVLVGDFVLANRKFGETVLREQLRIIVHAYQLRGGEHGE